MFRALMSLKSLTGPRLTAVSILLANLLASLNLHNPERKKRPGALLKSPRLFPKDFESGVSDAMGLVLGLLGPKCKPSYTPRI